MPLAVSPGGHGSSEVVDSEADAAVHARARKISVMIAFLISRMSSSSWILSMVKATKPPVSILAKKAGIHVTIREFSKKCT
jgi:hypothetical protein